MTSLLKTLGYMIIFSSIASCCKDKNDCIQADKKVTPFLQRFYYFACNTDNKPFEYILWSRAEVDSTLDSCYFYGSAVFPVDDVNNLYLTTADSLFNYSDTITGEVLLDTCKKEVVYNVKFEQRSKNPFPDASIASIFCIVENVPSDYNVTINKSRVWLP